MVVSRTTVGIWIIAMGTLHLTGCVTARLSKVETAPGFGWDTLKRDWILMSPLLDLRRSPKAPSRHKNDLDFYSNKERLDYAEKFKQEFFKWRKDIRVFGAGGAFDNLSRLDGLETIARTVINKEPLAEKTAEKIRSESQDLRFIFFFAITSENLVYDVDYTFRTDYETDLITYEAWRHFTVKMALWDSQENETVWIGTQHLSPAESNSMEVINPTKQKKVKKRKGKKDLISWEGSALQISLTEELAKRPERFPHFPDREPSLSATFHDFALSLPINPEEEKLIAFTHFSYHRPHLALTNSALGNQYTPGLEIGTSSIINFHYRFGAALQWPMINRPLFHTVEGKRQVSGLAYGLTFDLEWTLSDRLHLLTGLMAGGIGFDMSDPAALEERNEDSDDPFGDQDELEGMPEGKSDFAGIVWPRIRVLVGSKQGIQWGGGVTYRYFHGLEEEILLRNKPSALSVDFFMAYGFRGF